MLPKPIKYLIFFISLSLVLYHSVYFKRLDEVQLTAQRDKFDPQKYAADFWYNRLLKNLDSATDVNHLLELFENDMPQAIQRYARTLGIASVHSYLVKGQGQVRVIEETGIQITTREPQTQTDVRLKTSFIFGNAIRDASGLINVSDFPSTMEFNNISVEINRIVKNEIIPPLLKQIKVGQNINFVAATEVREQNPEIHPLELVPIQVEVLEK